jgi:PTH1 family peptidyl-tRNA hydrolase
LAEPIDLIAGLGNPGPKHEATRHNVGFWFVDAIARAHGGQWRLENKFQGECCKLAVHGRDVWLIKPQTFMNLSGHAVGALAGFYKIPPARILAVHDELDIPVGEVRLKKGGGAGGHNGLRDLIAQLGSPEFLRLRIGIGHPGNSRDVTNYVLKPPGGDERRLIDAGIDTALDVLPQIIAGEQDKAMQVLHTKDSD